MAYTGRNEGGGVVVWVLLGATAVLLALGLVLPVVHFDEALGGSTYSILGGVRNLVTTGNPGIGVLIFAFSVVFPTVKLVTLALLWRRGRRRSPRRVIGWLGLLGKWSMLDVYVVAILAGAVQLGILAHVESRPGIFVFGAAVVASMVATTLVQRRLGRHRGARLDEAARAELRRPLPRLLGTAALGLFAAGLLLPLMEVEKWLFWSNEYSILSSLPALAQEGEAGLALLVLACVVLLPAAHFLAVLWLRWGPPWPGRLDWVLALEEWAMADVFGLALIVVLVQVSATAEVTARAGLWCLLAAAAVTAADSFLLRRALLRGAGGR